MGLYAHELVEVNARIRDFAERAGAGSTWGFVCECGEPACTARVFLPLYRFDTLRAAGDAVLQAGHARLRAEAARANAVELQEESRALQNQARQQIRRASVVSTIRGTVEAVCAGCCYVISVRELPKTCPNCRSAGWLLNSPAEATD